MRYFRKLVILLLVLITTACSGNAGTPISGASSANNHPPTPIAATSTLNSNKGQATVSAATQEPPPVTSQPSMIRTPIQTASPSSSVTAWLNANPPAYAPESYRLREWPEAVIQNLLQQAFDRNINKSFDDENYAYIFQYEWLMRYPHSTEWVNGPWRLTILSPLKITFPDSAELKSVFAYIVETEANAAQGDPDRIVDKLRSYEFHVEEPLFVEDLFGPGNDGTVYEVAVNYLTLTASSYTTVFAVRSMPTGYQHVTLLDWHNTKYEYPTIETQQDKNQNGYPEILLYHQGYWSQHCWGDLSIYEWDGQVFSPRLNPVTVYNSLNFESDCAGNWQFQVADYATTPVLITSESRHSLPGCPDLEITSAYQWDGGQYQLISTDYLPIDFDQLACQVSWADMVMYYAEEGWQRDAEVHFLESLLPKWDASASEAMGPASHDYYQLRLALWHDLRDEPAPALSLLQSLAEQPISQAFDLPSRLALAYLDGRQQLGLLGGCFRAGNLWAGEIEAANLDDYFPNQTEILSAFGFWSPRWVGRIEDICTPSEIASTWLLPNNFNIENELLTRLKNVGAEVTKFQSGDINQDGRIDQIAVLDPAPGSRYSYPALWVFLNLAEGIKAIEITGLSQEPDPLPSHDFSWHTFSLPSDSSPAHIVWALDELVIFGVNGEDADVLLNSTGVISYQLSSDAQLVEILSMYTDETTQTVQVYWDPQRSRYTAQPQAITEIWEAVNKAEYLIFQGQDYLAASQFIESIFDEWGYGDSCLGYLLGLAYEMQGQPDQAVLAYYQVWQNFPGTMFGLASSARLELVYP